MSVSKSWEQHKQECEKVLPKGITLLSFIEPWNGAFTKVLAKCDIHGEWETSNITNLKCMRSGCPDCALIRIKTKNSKPDEFHVQQFMETGSFKVGTKFKKIESKGVNGTQYWEYTCPVCSNDEYVKEGTCSGVFKISTDKAKTGRIACRCSTRYGFTKPQWTTRMKILCEKKGYKFIGWVKDVKANAKISFICPTHGEKEISAKHLLSGCGCSGCANKNQTYGYINLVMDGDISVALKFGIANDPELRVTVQNYVNALKMSQFCVYKFPTVEMCKKAERKIKSTLECKFLTKAEIKDGWTETTAHSNLDKIKKIYQDFGGVIVKSVKEASFTF